LSVLAQAPILKAGGLLYLETPQAITPAPEQWETLRQNQAGQVVYGLFRKKPGVSRSEDNPGQKHS
ncbi:MAG: hypothetical protein JJT82_03265, partial [Legionellaceae bacterium]|nr:hypothetical protein [Legionellaceae bacterium]